MCQILAQAERSVILTVIFNRTSTHQYDNNILSSPVGKPQLVK